MIKNKGVPNLLLSYAFAFLDRKTINTQCGPNAIAAQHSAIWTHLLPPEPQHAVHLRTAGVQDGLGHEGQDLRKIRKTGKKNLVVQ